MISFETILPNMVHQAILPAYLEQTIVQADMLSTKEETSLFEVNFD